MIAQRAAQATAATRYRAAVEMGYLAGADAAWQEFCDACGWTFEPCGAFRVRRPLAPSRTILHWPGDRTSAEGLVRIWRRNETGSRVSSHCGVDGSGVWWYRAPHHVTHHAGPHNADSIGIDICAPILARDGEPGAYRFRRPAPNGGHHGGLVLPLDPAIASRMEKVRARLSMLVGHHPWVDHAFVDPDRKWDCAPWREVLHAHRAIDLPFPDRDDLVRHPGA